MITNRSFLADVGASLATLFKFTGTIRGGILVVLENRDDTNQLTYKVQESNDGVTWVDKSFTVGAETVTTFVLDANSAHTFRIQPSTVQVRVVASGSLTALVSLTYSTSNGNSPEIYA